MKKTNLRNGTREVKVIKTYSKPEHNQTYAPRMVNTA